MQWRPNGWPRQHVRVTGRSERLRRAAMAVVAVAAAAAAAARGDQDTVCRRRQLWGCVTVAGSCVRRAAAPRVVIASAAAAVQTQLRLAANHARRQPTLPRRNGLAVSLRSAGSVEPWARVGSQH
jgi:hypothetical protein